MRYVIVTILLVCCSLAPAWAGTSGSFSLWYNQPPKIGYLETKTLAFINGATQTLDVAIYCLNRQSIINALIARKNAGVRVRVVTETDYYNNAAYRPKYQQLETAGITVVPDVGTALMHNKFIVADNARVLTGSYNFTNDQTTKDKNMIITIASPALAAAYTQEFEQMFVQRKFHGSKVHRSGTVTVDGFTVQYYFSPSSGALAALTAAVNTANSNLYFDIYTFTATSVADAMIARKNAGVIVKGVFDAWQATSAYSQDDRLRAAGCSVRTDTYPGLLHEKVIAIDGGTTSDPIGVIGSFNWTASADASNDENLLIIHCPFVASSIKSQVVYVYNYCAK